MYIVGIDPGTVYSEADLVQGKIPSNGTRGNTFDSTFGQREFISCKVSAGNITTGMVVNVSSTYTVAVISLGGSTRLGRDGGLLGVAIVTATASVSANIWVQIWGRCNVIASTSCAPNVVLSPAAVATGGVDDAPAATASAFIDGIVTLASTNATSTLVAAWLTYPRWETLG
jgi:hypothetical protein